MRIRTLFRKLAPGAVEPDQLASSAAQAAGRIRALAAHTHPMPASARNALGEIADSLSEAIDRYESALEDPDI